MIRALILAAGRSQRMGRQKLLLSVEGKPVIARVADAVLGAPVDEVVTIVGLDREQIIKALPERKVRFVTNPNPDAEMLDSIRCGLRALSEPCDGVLVVPGDLPGLTSMVVATLVQAFRNGGHGIVVPVFERRRGHPLLFAWKYREEILAGYDATGLRGLLTAHPNETLEVPVEIPAVLEDLDVPEDYQRITGHSETL